MPSVPIPEAGSYDNGFMPTTATPVDAVAAYDAFKEGHLEDCGSGKYRVRWDEPTQTVSEGIGYGMLLSVSFGEQAVFDGLWRYYTDNLDPNGLMHWQRGGCEGSQPNENSNNAATDADLDVAMALVMAECRFQDPSYGASADQLISAIRQHETGEEGGFALLHPGDVFGGADCLNASYFAPAYYRVFAERAAATEDRDFWLALADDSYALIDIMDHPTTGFVPNWADASGNTSQSGPSGCAWYSDAQIFGTDAIRTPWRVAVDYLWWGTPQADVWLDKVTAFVLTQGIENVGRKFDLDGTPFGEVDHSIISLGAFANAAMAYDQATADAFAAEAVSNQDEGYFPASLRGLYLLVSAGLFTQCGGG
jgi:endo-1,4-beta-D-glucanase Y